MNTFRPFSRRACSPCPRRNPVVFPRRASSPAKWCWAALVLAATTAAAEPPVALQLGSLIVAPAHLPPVFVTARNTGTAAYQGTLTIAGPEGWTFRPPRIEIALEPGQSKRVAFTVTKGKRNEANRYPLSVTATGAGQTVVHRQEVACTSAPYFKPTIDGDPADWKDAIPVSFTTAGKKTVIRTFWNRRQLALLVAVEEDKLVAPGGTGPFDAVQLAISPQDTTTGASADGVATRYEFLLAGDPKAARCYLLAEVGTKLAETQKGRELAPLAYEDAAVAVSRDGGTTYYECAIPFKLMRSEIRPSEGREFCLSLLVHDPDGTGVRDWGAAAGLWESQRNRLAWSLWKGACWDDKPPFDNKTPWGLCSSKY